MPDNIHLYLSPTAGLSDGVRLDTDDQNVLGSLTVQVNSTREDETVTKMGVRTDQGYYISGDCVISLTGSFNHWSLLYNSDYESLDNLDNVSSVGWSSAISIAGVDDTNKVFWLKTTSEENEPITLESGAGLFAYGLVGLKESD